MHDRFRVPRGAVRERPRRTLLWLGLVVALLVAVVYVVGFSAVFVVKDVVVTGASPEVVATAEDNVRAPRGRPLARVDTSAMAERIREDRRIDDVEIQRSWPSSITVELTVRNPEAVLDQPGRPHVLVDEGGVAYQEVATPPADLPRVTAARGDVARESLVGALQVRSSLGEPWADEVRSLTVTADGEVRFDIGAIEVRWGRPSEAGAKAAAVRALLAQEPIDPDGETSLTIDVTAPGTPVVSGLTPAPAG